MICKHFPFLIASRRLRSIADKRLPPVLTSTKTTSLTERSSKPLNTRKSIGLPRKRASEGRQGKSGRYGASCSDTFPFTTACDRFTASARISRSTAVNRNRVTARPTKYPTQSTTANTTIPKNNMRNSIQRERVSVFICIPPTKSF